MLPKGCNDPAGLLGVEGSGLVGDRDLELFQRFSGLRRPDEEQAEVKADDGGPRELGRERPEPAESLGRSSFREGADGRCRARHGIVQSG